MGTLSACIPARACFNHAPACAGSAHARLGKCVSFATEDMHLDEDGNMEHVASIASLDAFGRLPAPSGLTRRSSGALLGGLGTAADEAGDEDEDEDDHTRSLRARQHGGAMPPKHAPACLEPPDDKPQGGDEGAGALLDALLDQVHMHTAAHMHAHVCTAFGASACLHDDASCERPWHAALCSPCLQSGRDQEE